MHIVIMGCGRTGAMLARGLEERGHSVGVIDTREEAFARLSPRFRGQTVRGVGFDRQVLEAAGIRTAGGFAAVSSGDNSNILAARVVKEIYRVENVVARIYDQGRAQVYERLGIPTVAPVRWTTAMVMRRLLPEGSEPVWRDPSGQARILQVAVHRGWVNRRISELSAAAGCVIPVITRLGTGIVPNNQTVFQDGDLVFAACEIEQTSNVELVLGNPPKGH
ncbi:TrkA family potassium uptake protein [Tessaracoccus sp. OH4464_COT-324]|uniref:potassium channel family protein n=1 Tax=Tessaracoccus sp. OH4464_COT-324 TaxID=2491059 RepID=UPI000F62F4FD|nr:TrkA family potassium uptake protein [Tessaracoccus sp. OH4464_COT-324]RRD47396.1 TrkA family potassium uptake protein [Tessaracoccus sp. OH4464_COT-324]